MRVGVLLSGNGTTMEAITEEFNVVVVMSDNARAKGLEKARKLNIPTVSLEPNTTTYEPTLSGLLQLYQVDVICLAGYLQIVREPTLTMFKDKIMNIHPALLPAFRGRDPQKQAVEYGAKVTGNTIHFVDQGIDTGAIILQSTVPIREGDTEKEISEVLTKDGHLLYLKALSLYKEGRLVIEGRKVSILPRAVELPKKSMRVSRELQGPRGISTKV